MKKKIAVIGGGITGLVAGYRSLQKGYTVTIFEKCGELGGLLGGFKIQRTNLEKAYHHIFKTDKEIISLIDELRLSDKLKWHESKTALYYDQKIYPFSGVIDLLKFKPLNLIDKLRLGLVKIYLEKENNWQKFENVLAYEWMKRWCGNRAYKVVWEPLLRGKFSNRYRDISMAWMWARIHTRGNSSEKGKELLGYVKGGFQQIIDELERRILKLKGRILLKQEIKLEILEREYDKIITTAPLKNVDYLGAMTVVFSSKQNLSKYYWHNINDIDSPILSFIQHTNLVGSTNYGGKNVYYMGTYLPQEHQYFKDDDKKIYKDFFDYLKKIFPKFNEKEIEEKYVFKFKYAQHIVTKNYKGYMAKNEGKIIHANFAQIYPEDRGINFGVREGEKVIRNL